jgi:tetratricopeptide (TPR) repeat protein
MLFLTGQLKCAATCHYSLDRPDLTAYVAVTSYDEASLIDRLKLALADRYAIERELGLGGMATVYLARDRKHNRAVAVKVLNPELASVIGPDRFLREIEISARLDHPHILPLYDSGAADGFLYYVMPYIEGGTLRDRLAREKQLPLDDALQIAREVADALSYAHGHGVVHRDIKPENIMLAGGHARVADFGIARAISAAGGQRLTQTGVAVGTPVYMSPEQAAGVQDLDGRSDLYSLACVLFEMLAGSPPFTGTPEMVVRQHLAAEPPAITSLRPAVSPHVAGAIMRALSKTPADRFNPAAQFADALRPPAAPLLPQLVNRSVTATDPTRATIAFVIASAVVLAAITLLVWQAGLPMWVFWVGVALVAVGLPIIVSTANAERARALGAPGSRLTWRRTMLGGALAFGALTFITAGYTASRALGIGPFASLSASGAIGARERIVLADFEDRLADSSQTATTVTELMRVGLSRSRTVSIVDPAQVSRILRMMQRDPREGLPGEVAIEAAMRDGMKAVITGEVSRVGAGLSLTARLVSVNGEVLVAETQVAASADELTVAVDRLSDRLRQRFGESLKSIRAGLPLDRLTTGSLKALRLFSQGQQAWSQGDNTRAMQLIDEAIAEDSTFAMAYRRLAILLNNQDEQRARSIWAAQKAYEYRDRLTDRERYLVIAAYHRVVTGNRDQQISAYRTVIDLYPDEIIALNNLGVIYGQLRQFERASSYYGRALGVDSTNRLHYSNLAGSLNGQRLLDSAGVIARRFERRFPGNPEVKLTYAINQAGRKNFDSAAVLVRGLLADQRGTVYWEAIAYEWWGALDALRGQMKSARTRWSDASRRAEGRGQEGTYLMRAARRSMAERLLLDDAAQGRKIVDDALARFPLESLNPLDRPYGLLAMAYATAGNLPKARALLSEFERTAEADHNLEAESWADGARGIIALAEGRTDDAVTAFRKLDDGSDCFTCAAPWLARSYDRAGQTDSVVALFTRFVDQPSSQLWYDDSHLAHAFQRLGEIHESRNDPHKAVEYYRRLLDLMKTPDPELRPRIDVARRALTRLTGERSATER